MLVAGIGTVVAVHLPGQQWEKLISGYIKWWLILQVVWQRKVAAVAGSAHIPTLADCHAVPRAFEHGQSRAKQNCASLEHNYRLPCGYRVALSTAVTTPDAYLQRRTARRRGTGGQKQVP